MLSGNTSLLLSGNISLVLSGNISLVLSGNICLVLYGNISQALSGNISLMLSNKQPVSCPAVIAVMCRRHVVTFVVTQVWAHDQVCACTGPGQVCACTQTTIKHLHNSVSSPGGIVGLPGLVKKRKIILKKSIFCPVEVNQSKFLFTYIFAYLSVRKYIFL